MAEKIFEIEGNTNELLMIDNVNGLKSTRLFYMGDDLMDSSSEVVDVQITSSNPEGQTPLFDSIIDKKIRVTVELIGQDDYLN